MPVARLIRGARTRCNAACRIRRERSTTDGRTGTMKPWIFISHSCKDAEQEKVAAGDAARAERLAFARAVRAELHQGLIATKEFKVWLDVRDGLRPGDEWRLGIHRALHRCRGAVL